MATRVCCIIAVPVPLMVSAATCMVRRQQVAMLTAEVSCRQCSDAMSWCQLSVATYACCVIRL